MTYRPSRYDQDPEALAWARTKIQDEIDRCRKFAEQAHAAHDTEQAEMWRRLANRMQRMFIGGEGCVMGYFDERLPALHRSAHGAPPNPPSPLDEQGPDDQETVGEAAAMYRNLRPVIEATMTDSDRWDGDESEEFHLGRYVQWLAAERATVRHEELHAAADRMEATNPAAAADLRQMADTAAPVV